MKKSETSNKKYWCKPKIHSLSIKKTYDGTTYGGTEAGIYHS